MLSSGWVCCLFDVRSFLRAVNGDRCARLVALRVVCRLLLENILVCLGLHRSSLCWGGFPLSQLMSDMDSVSASVVCLYFLCLLTCFFFVCEYPSSSRLLSFLFGYR